MVVWSQPRCCCPAGTSALPADAPATGWAGSRSPRSSPPSLAAALGLFYAAFYLGMAAMQPLAGLLRDVTGSPAAPLFFAAATMVLTVVALGAFRWIERRRSTSPRP